MTALKNTFKNKHLKDLIIDIPYSFLEKCAFLMLSIFILFPFLRVIIMLSGTRMSLDGYHRFFWYEHNRYVLLFGSIIIAIYLLKLKMDGIIKAPLKELKKHPSIVLFLIFSLLMVISTVLSGIDSIKLNGIPYCGEGLTGCLSYIVYLFLAILLIKEKSRMLLIKIFATTAALNFIATIYDYAVLNRKFDFIEWSTLFFNSNHYGYYILLAATTYSMFFLLSKKMWIKILNLCLYIFSIIILLLNNTFGCQVALLVGVIFICIVYSIAKGKFMPLTLVIAAAFFASYFIGYNVSDTIKTNINNNLFQFSNDVGAMSGQEHAPSSGVNRIILYERTLEHISEKPLLGFGADGADRRLKIESDGVSGRCHSDYLHYAVCYGIPAALIYIAAVFFIYLRGLKFKDKLSDINLLGLCVAFSHLVSAAVGNSMFYTTPFLFIFLGFGYYKQKDQ